MIQFATTTEVISQPLSYGLMQTGLQKGIRVHIQDAQQNLKDLLQRRVNAAVISVLDYATNSSELRIFSDIAVCSPGATRYALLFFRSNLQSIEQIALTVADTQYHVLTNLLFKEYFETEPGWVEISPGEPLESVLDVYPAVLLEKEEAIKNYFKIDTYLDILEEWSDKTGLPFTHQVVACPRDENVTELVEELLLSRELGMRNVMTIAKEAASGKEAGWSIYFDLLNEMFSYFPDSASWDGLRQFYEYLFYHGFIDYIPELHFL